MDKDILIAIIAAIAAGITSIISLIATLLSAKKSEKANQNLEKLRLDQEQVKLLLGIKTDSFEESLKALEETCVVIQKCKDDLRTFLSGNDSSKKNKDFRVAANMFDDLIAQYQKKHYLLISEHRLLLHELKNKAIDAQGILSRFPSVKNQDEVIKSLKVFLDELGETQTAFLEHRDKMISAIGTSSK